MRLWAKLITVMSLASALVPAHSAMTEEQAQAVLNDDSYFRRWSQPGAITSVAEAEKVKEQGDRELARIEEALGDMKKVCYGRFFVNSCIEDARKLSFVRDREIRKVRNQADAIIRADKTREIQERRARSAAEVKEPPMKPRAAGSAKPAPATPEARTPREARDVTPLTPKKPRAASEPMVIDNTAAERVREKNAEAAEKRALEADNVAAYEAKQREAAERMKAAREKAEERRKEREAQQESFEKSRLEREQAQKRYQEQQNQNRSSLSKYF